MNSLWKLTQLFETKMGSKYQKVCLKQTSVFDFSLADLNGPKVKYNINNLDDHEINSLFSCSICKFSRQFLKAKSVKFYQPIR